MRAQLWNGVDKSKTLPTPGEILSEITNGNIDRKSYDTNSASRYKNSIW
jgi:hypothetical protein